MPLRGPEVPANGLRGYAHLRCPCVCAVSSIEMCAHTDKWIDSIPMNANGSEEQMISPTPDPNSDPNALSSPELEDDICVHIFTASATLVGVCLTVIGIFRISEKLRMVSFLGDDLLSLDAAIFMVSNVLSYVALRARLKTKRRQYERFADALFLLGLGLMVVVCSLITYELV